MQVTVPQPVTPKVTPRADSELLRGWKQLDVSADMAEVALVAGNFAAAATRAEELLRRTFYISDNAPIQLRATYVLLQALYELDRFHEAKNLLIHHYTALSQLAPEVLCLWVSLAVDTPQRAEAAEVLKTSLRNAGRTVTPAQRHKPYTPGQKQQHHLTNQQYAAASRLYCIEVLAKSFGRISEAEHWVEHEAHMLQESQKQDLLHELADLAPKSSSTRPDKSCTQPNRFSTVSDTQTRHDPATTAQSPLPQAWTAFNKSSAEFDEIQPAEEQTQSSSSNSLCQPLFDANHKQHNEATSSNSWLQSGQNWVVATSEELTNKANALWYDEVVAVGGFEMTSTQLLSAAALAALLSAAAIAERKVLHRLALKSMRWLQRSITDATAAAFSLTPNPINARVNPLR